MFFRGLNFPVADGERTKHQLSWKEPMTVMTQGEQSAALMLIRDGAGYKRIASQLGLPVNTVKSFCRKVAAGATHTCPNCGKQVAADAKFCPECGKAMTNVCPSCGKTVKGDVKFCPECGAKVK